MEQREDFLGKERTRQGRLGLKASEVGLIPLVVAIDELNALVASAGTKSAASRFAYSNSLKRSLKWCYSCSRFRSLLAWTLFKRSEGRNYRQKFFSALHLLNWCEWSSQRLALGLGLLVSLRVCSCRWTAGREPGRYQVPAWH